MKRLMLLTIMAAAPAAEAACIPPPDAPPMCLVGTITSSGYSAAFVELPDTPVTQTLKLDSRILDWRVLKIAPRSVLLGDDQKRATLTLNQTPDDATPTIEPVQASSESIASQSMRLRLLRKQAHKPS